MRLKGLVIGGCLAALAYTMPACAQSVAAPQGAAEDVSFGDIVVTATRREERLRDVPISVTALGEAGLEAKMVSDVTSLARVVPGMQVKPTLNPLQTTVAIRGITQLGSQVASDPPVATYVDGVYNVVNAGSNSAMIDMERVEVLKGPQGTLFGRNTIGGAISITTKKPTDQFEGLARVEGGNFGALTVTGVVNLPVAPGVLDARLVYQHSEHDGYGRNLVTGSPVGTFNQEYVRGSLRFHDESGVELLLTGFYNDGRGYSPAIRAGYYNPASPFNTSYPAASGNPGDLLTNYVDGGGPQDAVSNVDSTFALRQYGGSLTGSIELGGGITLKSITGYTHTEYDQVVDLDGTPYSVLEILAYPVRAKQFSEELQVFGDAFGNKLQYIAGLYYFVVDGSQITSNAALPMFTPPAARTLNVTGPYVRNRSYSAFAQVTYSLSDKLRLTGGVRYVVDRRHIQYRDYRQPLSQPPGMGDFVGCLLANYPNGSVQDQCSFSDSAKYNFVPFTVGIDYKPNPDTLLYAKFSRGYRSGAFSNAGPSAVFPSATVTPDQAAIANAAVIGAFEPVAPERLISPEIGAKFNMLDNRLAVSLAAYFSRYSNIQVGVNLPPACSSCTPLFVLRNSGTADIYGGELEVNARLGPLLLDGALGYTHPEYRRGSASYGAPLVNVSKFNGAVSASLPVETSAGRLTFGGTYSYRSKMYLSPIAPGETLESHQVNIQKGFGLLDARITFDVGDAPISFAIFGQNLTDKRYRISTSSFGPPLSFAWYIPGTPLTYGASATVRF